MRFYFIRHAQSENNLLYDNTGSSVGRSDDPQVTDVGKQQIQVLARFLRTGNPHWNVNHSSSKDGFGITHIYTSLMVRAITTGIGIAQVLGLPLVAWKDLHETGGIYQENEVTGERTGLPGKKRADFEKLFPHLILPDSLDETGWWNQPFEEHEQRLVRAQRFIDELMRRHGGTDDQVAVISHGGFYNYFLRALFDIQREDSWFELNNAAITRISFSEERVRALYMNRVEYLPKELVT